MPYCSGSGILVADIDCRKVKEPPYRPGDVYPCPECGDLVVLSGETHYPKKAKLPSHKPRDTELILRVPTRLLPDLEDDFWHRKTITGFQIQRAEDHSATVEIRLSRCD